VRHPSEANLPVNCGPFRMVASASVSDLLLTHSQSRREEAMRAAISIAILFLITLSACSYNGPNLRDCSEWRTRSIPGCGEPSS